MNRILLALLALLLPFTAVTAQEDPEYRLEIGAGAGVMNYMGDFNGNLLKGFRPQGGIVVKYKPNVRMAWALNASYGQVKGDSKNVATYYPAITAAPLTFSSKLVSADVRFEYNFWPFGTGHEYLGAQPLTPFIALGLGAVYAKNEQSKVAFQVPIGLGVKYKLADRLNLSLEWMMHFSGSDLLDGVKDPYGIKSSGFFKNTDCYSTVQVSLTYDLWAICKTCNNDRD